MFICVRSRVAKYSITLEVRRSVIRVHVWMILFRCRFFSQTADDINPLVDAVVQSMYPPLDSFVLVAQATELVRSARSLAALVVGGGGGSVTTTAAVVAAVDGRVVDANSDADGDVGRGAVFPSLLPASSSVGLSRRRYRQVDKLVAGAERSLQVRPRPSKREEKAGLRILRVVRCSFSLSLLPNLAAHPRNSRDYGKLKFCFIPPSTVLDPFFFSMPCVLIEFDLFSFLAGLEVRRPCRRLSLQSGTRSVCLT